jgi:hypothetical protein
MRVSTCKDFNLYIN